MFSIFLRKHFLDTGVVASAGCATSTWTCHCPSHQNSSLAMSWLWNLQNRKPRRTATGTVTQNRSVTVLHRWMLSRRLYKSETSNSEGPKLATPEAAGSPPFPLVLLIAQQRSPSRQPTVQPMVQGSGRRGLRFEDLRFGVSILSLMLWAAIFCVSS